MKEQHDYRFRGEALSDWDAQVQKADYAGGLRVTLRAIEAWQRKTDTPWPMHPDRVYVLDTLYDHAAVLYEELKVRGKETQAAGIVKRYLKV